MSSIGPDTRLNLSGLDRIGGQALDDLRGQPATAPEALQGALVAAEEARSPATDAGEDILNAGAWDATGPASACLRATSDSSATGHDGPGAGRGSPADAVLDALA